MSNLRSGSQRNFGKIPVLGLVPEGSSSAPSSPAVGQLWNDTSASPNVVRYWNGTVWLRMDQVGAELTANKGAASGYMGLDGSSKAPIANLPLGSTSSTVTVGNDARLSDTRTPTAGSVVPASFGATAIDPAAGVAGARTLGTGAAQAFPGNGRLDQVSAPTSAVSLNGQRATSAADPVNPQDLATKNYVDLARQGLAGVKDPAIAASTTNITIASPGTSIGGVTPSVTTPRERYLLTAQTTGTENGIYEYNGSAVPMTRANDSDAAGETQDGTTVAVGQGTSADTRWVQQATPSGSIGAWTQVWTVISTGATYTASNGLQMVGNDVRGKKDTTDPNNYLTFGAAGIGVGTTPVALGGTGAITAAAAKTNLGFTTTVTALLGAMTAGVEYVWTHGIGNKYVLPVFTLEADDGLVELGWRWINTTQIGITADQAGGYGANAVRATAIG